jgi:hypothetical protein
MPHIKILNIDTDLLLQLTNNNINIGQFSSLKILIIRQINNLAIVEPLTIVSRLGVSSSISFIHLQQYRANFESTNDDPALVICQICHNMCKLKVIIIEFNKDALFNKELLEKFNTIHMRNSLEYIHLSNAYIELWFGQ